MLALYSVVKAGKAGFRLAGGGREAELGSGKLSQRRGANKVLGEVQHAVSCGRYAYAGGLALAVKKVAPMMLALEPRLDGRQRRVRLAFLPIDVFVGSREADPRHSQPLLQFAALRIDVGEEAHVSHAATMFLGHFSQGVVPLKGRGARLGALLIAQLERPLLHSLERRGRIVVAPVEVLLELLLINLGGPLGGLIGPAVHRPAATVRGGVSPGNEDIGGRPLVAPMPG